MFSLEWVWKGALWKYLLKRCLDHLMMVFRCTFVWHSTYELCYAFLPAKLWCSRNYLQIVLSILKFVEFILSFKMFSISRENLMIFNSTNVALLYIFAGWVLALRNCLQMVFNYIKFSRIVSYSFCFYKFLLLHEIICCSVFWSYYTGCSKNPWLI